ncbi:hypothetical protein NEHOM01_0924 [Nematocida homosporus]|uniref:uncharacterized protein n=1 Tax=Nematocida homosporus TaxID=1912981 RepID=UPI00221F0401|nr:uncharacterized protein NEHOM01_0924 [Nematocida homosporus]KAI5185598.1 hypothetical protein NEHOM01_0924 [Nematocida homosporus]
MEYLLKSLSTEASVQPLLKQTILINELLGASIDFFIPEILQYFQKPVILSLFRLAREYSTSTPVYSLLEDPTALTKAIETPHDLLLVDGWNLSPERLSLPATTIILINRSVTDLPYKDMYNAFILFTIRPLQTRALLYTGSLSITARSLGLEIDLLYRQDDTVQYTLRTD